MSMDKPIFPIPTLPKLVPDSATRPSFTTLTDIQVALNNNAHSVHSTIGTGNLGHLALTMRPAEFLVLSVGVAHAPPAHPGDAPNHGAGATAPLITETNRKFIHDSDIFRAYHTTDNALKLQLIAACPDEYLVSLKDPSIGFARVTTLDMLTHLWAEHGVIRASDLAANIVRMNTPWHPPTSINIFFHQLDTAAAFAIAGGCPIGDIMVMHSGYETLFATGVFELPCRDWRNRSLADQTMANFYLCSIARCHAASRQRRCSRQQFHSESRSCLCR
jgi:hypothetical protein